MFGLLGSSSSSLQLRTEASDTVNWPSQREKWSWVKDGKKQKQRNDKCESENDVSGKRRTSEARQQATLQLLIPKFPSSRITTSHQQVASM
jgi:hypothetical protein